MTLTIDELGVIRAIYNDDLADLLQAGAGTLTRASHVEPDPNRLGFWTADLGPVGGPKLSGFALRSEALAAEEKWLIENFL